MGRRLKFVLIGGFALGSAFLLCSLFVTFGDDWRPEPVEMAGPGMSPTINDGDIINVRGIERPERYDIVLYECFYDEQNICVARVIGVPGEVLEIRDSSVRIDGVILDEPYIAEPIAYEIEKVGIGFEQYYLLGDNRNHSWDSHLEGTVSKDEIVGLVELDAETPAP